MTQETIQKLSLQTQTSQVQTTDQTITIAVVGDVHEQWDDQDAAALHYLGVDLVLFVGDFGNESVQLVNTIANLDLPKAVVLGNHDAWYSASEWGMKKCPYDRKNEDRVQQQLDLLGESHVGYSKLDFPGLNLTVVGSRPFSWGGPEWKNADFYRSRYGITSFAESTNRIVSAVKSAAFETIIFLGHSGPTGLGNQPNSPCGRDWNPLGGDFGDPDFAAAISQAKALNKIVPLVAFGHMHHHLRHTKSYQRIPLISGNDNTIYLNAACVPRIKQDAQTSYRNFSIVVLKAGQINQVSLVWLNQSFDLISEQKLYTALENPLITQPQTK